MASSGGSFCPAPLRKKRKREDQPCPEAKVSSSSATTAPAQLNEASVSPANSATRGAIVHLDGALLFRPYGSKAAKRKYLHYMAWKQVAGSFGLKYEYRTFGRVQKLGLAVHEVFAMLSREQGVDVDAKAAAVAKSEYYKRISSGIPIGPVLRLVKLRGADAASRVAVVSRLGAAHVKATLEKLEIDSLVDCAVADTHPDDEKAVRSICTRLGVDPSHCVLVDGTDASRDCAAAIGAKFLDARTLFEFPSGERGTVSWYDRNKGYGFVTPAAGGKDLFVHQSEILGSGFRFLERGERVQYRRVVRSGGRPAATRVQAPHGAILACAAAAARPASATGPTTMELA